MRREIIQPMSTTPGFPFSICSRKTKKLMLLLWICLTLLHVANGGYAMQPPPPPLNIAQLKTLITAADLIIVGKIAVVKETESTMEATLNIKKLLKGKVVGKTIVINETYKAPNSQATALGSNTEGESPKIVRTIAGPSTYHGKYKNGARVVVLLKKIDGTSKYIPLGSGTYNKYLGEFIIEDDGIKSIEINYFRFAEDVGKYTGSEKLFIRFIKQLINSSSNREGK